MTLERKEFGIQALRFFADAQNDTGEPIHLFLFDEIIVQFVGINGLKLNLETLEPLVEMPLAAPGWINALHL
jgi:hypothetical protein